MAFENYEDINDPSIIQTQGGYLVNAPTVSVSPDNIPTGVPEKPQYSRNAQALRSLVTGASLGFGEELEAGLRAPFSDEDYKQIRDRLRAQQAQYVKDYPLEATASELAGGLLLPAGILGSAYKAGKGAWQIAKAGAGAGAATGAVTGAGVAPEVSDIPSSMATYGAAGGALGAVVPSAVGAVGNVGGRVISGLVDSLGFSNANKIASKKIMNYMEKDNLTPQQVQDMLNEYRRVGVPDPVIADLGANLQKAGYSAYIVPSKAKGATESFLENRNAELAMALTRGLEQKAGVKSQGKFGFDYISDLAAQQDIASQKAYPKATSMDIPAAPFRKYANRDLFAKAYEEAKLIADAKGEFLPELSQIRNAQFINTGILQKIKIGLDEVVNKETDALTNKTTGYGKAVKDVRKEFNDLIKYYNKDYAQANAKFADFAKLKEAYNDGLDYMKMETSELAAKLKKMTSAEKESFRVGMISDIRNKLANFKGGDPKRLVFQSDTQKKALRYAFDDEGQFKDFVRQIDYQNNLLKTQKKVLGGSPTVENREVFEDASMVGKAATGNVAGAIGQFLSRNLSRAGGITSPVSAEMQKILFNPSARGQSDILNEMIKNQRSLGMLGSNPVTYGGLLGQQSALE